MSEMVVICRFELCYRFEEEFYRCRMILVECKNRQLGLERGACEAWTPSKFGLSRRKITMKEKRLFVNEYNFDISSTIRVLSRCKYE